MVEVTNNNFDAVLNDFEHSIKKCAFFAIDCEFTTLPTERTDNSFLDFPEERYSKIKRSVNCCLIIQIGITPFRYNRDLNHYKASPYNFYVFPRPFGTYNSQIEFSSLSIGFLCNSNFNFNKVFYNGIPFMNSKNINSVLDQLKNGTLLNNVEKALNFDERNEIILIREKIKKWISSSKEDFCELVCEENNPAFNYALTEEIISLSKNIWAEEKNKKIIVTKVNPEERIALERDAVDNYNKTIFLDSLKGFSKIFELLAASKKPMVGHNTFLDFLIMYHQFHGDLPDSYSQFKKSFNKLFPHIYDTKYIAYGLEYLKNSGKYNSTSLMDVYEYYQDSANIFHFPYIELEPKGIYENDEARHSHDAGWDSYMTGFIFLKMADEYARMQRKEKHLANILSTELLCYMEKWENKIKIARCVISYLDLAGDDPPSKRPPLLHVCHFKKQCLRMVELDAAFKKYEPIYKKQLDLHSALIAAPNYRCFNGILLDFINSKELKVEKYSLVKHNRKVQACLITGLCVPVVLTIWLSLLK